MPCVWLPIPLFLCHYARPYIVPMTVFSVLVSWLMIGRLFGAVYMFCVLTDVPSLNRLSVHLHLHLSGHRRRSVWYAHCGSHVT